jgi:4-amino-4-deoxy-L-arabinose transferase-like glycosyltransferase
MRLAAEKDRRALAPTPVLGPVGGDQAARRAAWRIGRIALLVVGCLCCAALLFVHLDRSPRTWFDEGSHLHVPKTLVQTGHYADRSSEGFRAFGPTIGVGPTVMLPIAAVFKIGGIGLLGARLVIALYTMIAIGAFALLMNRLAGGRVALVAAILMLAAPGLDFITTGRQVLGEVPAFAYLLVGLLVWFTRDDATGDAVLTGCTKRCIIAGGFFGLTIVTKSQLGIVIAPSLIALAILALVWDRRIGLKQALVPLIVMLVVFGTWELALLTIVTGGSLRENLLLLRQASGGSLIVVAPHRMIAGARFLLGPQAYFALLIPALVYAGVRAIRRRMSVGELTLLIFALVGFAWFAGASVAWPRYAFVPLALAALPVARLVDDGVRALWRRPDRGRLLAPLAALALGVLVATSFGGQLHQTLAASDAPQQMAAYLNRSVPTSAIIETWEPELGVLTDHRYHYPPPSLLDRSVRHQWLGGPSLDGYDPLAGGAEYLIIGPFARYSGIYDEAAIAARYQRVTTVGDYALFRLRESAAGGPNSGGEVR